VSGEYFEQRWNSTNFCSLIIVDRERINLKDNRLQVNRAYYISNSKAEKSNEYFKAIRNH
jgi:hypothetical protein